MKVVQLTGSEQGGAGVVARNLSQGLLNLGVQSETVALLKSDLRSEPFSAPLLTASAILDEYIVKSNSTRTQISYFRSKLSSKTVLNTSQCDLLNLHWVQGVLTTEDIKRLFLLRTPLVWTMHDMAPFTSVCHHSGGCTGFHFQCSSCPQARTPFRHGIEIAMLKKIQAFNQARDVVFVAPSNWLANKARKSSILSDHDVRVIPNPIDSVFLQPLAKSKMRIKLGLNQGSHVISIVAKNLGDPNKQIRVVIEQFQRFRLQSNFESQLLLVGDGELNMPLGPNVRRYTHRTPEELREIYCASDVLVSASIDETFGLTLAEAAAVGTLILTSEGHAGSDLVQDGIDGFKMSTAHALAHSLEKIFALGPEIRESIAQSGSALALSKCDPKQVAESYKKIYEELLLPGT